MIVLLKLFYRIPEQNSGIHISFLIFWYQQKYTDSIIYEHFCPQAESKQQDLVSFHDGGASHTAADAQSCKTFLCIASLHLM